MKRQGGDRIVVLTNGKEYIAQANTTFGIVRFGSKAEALRYTLADAVGIIKDIKQNSLGVHKLHAELVNDGQG